MHDRQYFRIQFTTFTMLLLAREVHLHPFVAHVKHWPPLQSMSFLTTCSHQQHLLSLLSGTPKPPTSPRRSLASTNTTHSAIHTLRLGMWDPVVARSHNPHAVFPLPASASEQEIMLHGTVSYTLKDGRRCQDVEWAARGTLVESGGEVRWKRYQVYMVCHISLDYTSMKDEG